MNITFKRTKILATVGPASNSQEMITKLAEAGVNGFRLNFSHGSYEERDEQIQWIRNASKQTERSVAILQDLQGPKIRLGMLNENVDVNEGDEIILDHAAEHNGNVFPVQYNLAEKVKVGEIVYIFDGKIRTEVIEIGSGTAIKLKVKNPGTLMSKKGINLPDTDFGGDIMTEKDLKDVEFGASRDIDYVALSFVQKASDIVNLRNILNTHGSQAHIVAKIETKVAILEENLEEIVKASDAVMVARGDLAVEAGAEVVPIVQRQIVALCRKHGKICIVATQMMASMVESPEPTRAEVSDVATAVVLGADTVMLSDETANGKYPIEAVSAMKKVIVYTQNNIPVSKSTYEVVDTEKQRDAISEAAVSIANNINAEAIIAETKSGGTANNIAKHRPNLPIISVTSESRTAQQLALSYANRSYVRPDSLEAGFELFKELKESGYFEDDNVTVVIVSGNQPGVVGKTDTIKVRSL